MGSSRGAGFEFGQRGRLALHGDPVHEFLALIGNAPDPEGSVEAELETVKISHAAEAQKNGLSMPYDPVGCPVMGAGNLATRPACIIAVAISPAISPSAIRGADLRQWTGRASMRVV